MSEEAATPDGADIDSAIDHAVQFDGPMLGSQSRYAAERPSAGYSRASWRNTTLMSDEGQIGLGFDLDGGGVIRVSFNERSALNIIATLANQLSARQNNLSHSDRLSETPSAEGSAPDDGKSE